VKVGIQQKSENSIVLLTVVVDIQSIHRKEEKCMKLISRCKLSYTLTEKVSETTGCDFLILF